MSAKVPENMPPGAAPPQTAPWLRLQANGADGPVACTAENPVVLVGSRRDCHLPVPHPDISKTHCALINTGRAILVRDLVSRSGTFINNAPVRTAQLKPKDVLRVGPVVIEVKTLADTPAREAPRRGDPLKLPAPIRVELHGKQVELTDNAVVIGRRNSADVVIDTPDTSLAHAVLFTFNGRPAIGDLGSRSGTWVNGERIDLCWLENGAEVEIGGEQFCVRWDEQPVEETVETVAEVVETAAAQPAETAPPAPAPTPAPAAATQPVAAMPNPGGLDELEQTIAAVHGRIAAARGRLDERTRELDQRNAALSQQVAEFEARQARLEQVEAGLAARQAEISRAEQEFGRTRTALEQQTQKLAQEQGALQQLRAEAEARGAQLEQQRQSFEGERAALAGGQAQVQEARAALEREQQELNTAREACRGLEGQVQERAAALEKRAAEVEAQAAEMGSQREALQAGQAELAAARAAQAELNGQVQELEVALAKREAAVAEREAALKSALNDLAERESTTAKREQELQARELALGAREAQNADIDGRIHEFKEALLRAGELFTTPPEPPRGRGGGAQGGRAQGSSSPGTAPNGGTQAAAAADLPGPMVDQPIFSADAFPPPDWPDKLRERFRVLRRMSKKSDRELVQQVWADRERVLAQPDPPPVVSKRKKRFWGN